LKEWLGLHSDKLCAGMDPDFTGAFPGGPPPTPMDFTRRVMKEPEVVEAEIAQRMKERRALREKTTKV